PNLGFINTDSYFLQQKYWAKVMGDRLVANKDLSPFEIYRLAAGIEEESTTNEEDADEDNTDPLGTALELLHEDLNYQQAAKLSQAVKLFDWVIRSVHLLPATEMDAEAIADSRLNDSESLSGAGIPGLGYTRFPWQTMLYSRGDFVERAKLFVSMLEQQGIDSVLISFKKDERFVPWSVAVPVADKLFLFDTKLALPIPGKQVGQIATLTDLRSNPELLTKLNLSVKESLNENAKYWVTENDLKELKADLLVTPESLAYRFWELESKLVGDARIQVVINPTKIIQSLPKIEGLNYGLSDIEFETHQFRRTIRDAIASASFNDDIRNKLTWYYIDELYIDEFVRYRSARSKYFAGKFDVIRRDGQLNAIEHFYNMIYKDAVIDSLASDRNFQIAMSLNRGTMSAAEFSNAIKAVQANMRLVRRDSGYFLSHCHFDNGNFSTAINWLTRLERIANTERWHAAINYLRGRSLEAQRDYESAIEVYKKEESEQFHGDLIRVRLLKSLIPQSVSIEKSSKSSLETNEAEVPFEEPDSPTESSEDEPSESPNKLEDVENEKALESEQIQDSDGDQRAA
ncbi:MAG: CDC27 family protein, partial [Planctomycetota bacterium]